MRLSILLNGAALLILCWLSAMSVRLYYYHEGMEREAMSTFAHDRYIVMPDPTSTVVAFALPTLLLLGGLTLQILERRRATR